MGHGSAPQSVQQTAHMLAQEWDTLTDDNSVLELERDLAELLEIPKE